MLQKDIEIIDLFCGVGGLSYGLHKSGLNVIAGIDIDNSCKYAFEENIKSKFILKDIESIKSEEIIKLYSKNKIKILTGCAPCQPFSSYTFSINKNDDSRWKLLYKFSKLINDIKPHIVSMENVPQLLNFKKAKVFQDFILNLQKEGYQVWFDKVYCPDYGIPQKRKRLVLLASKLGKIELIKPTHTKDKYLTVRDVIGDLPKLSSGEVCKEDLLHRAAKLSEKNIERIRQSKPGGSWKKDWTDDLKLDCHKKDKGKTYVSVYGRMMWDQPSPTMTTFCTGIGNGRFGHPEQDRAISLREAAILQSFPKDYIFVNKEENIRVSRIATHIGNAVPPKLGEIIGKSIIKHIEELKL